MGFFNRIAEAFSRVVDAIIPGRGGREEPPEPPEPRAPPEPQRQPIFDTGPPAEPDADASEVLTDWASDKEMTPPDEWFGVQPYRFGPEESPRAGGFHIWDESGNLFYTEVSPEEYQRILDWMEQYNIEGELFVIDDEEEYA